MNKQFLFLLFFIICLFSVSAISIGTYPLSDRTIIFQPGLEKTFTFEVFGAESIEAIFSPDIFGEYITLEDPNPNGGRRELTVNIAFPDEIPVETGRHVVYVGALDVSNSDGSGMVARTAVKTGIVILVLSQDQDLKGSFVVEDVNLGKNSNYSLELTSWSYKDITAVVNFQFFDSLGSEILSFSEETFILATEGVILRNMLETSSWDPGNYYAKAIVSFDKTMEFADEFVIGELGFILLLTNSSLFAGEVGKVSFELESSWTSNMVGLYAVLYFNEGEFRSANFNFVPKEIVDLEFFVDLDNFGPGVYPANLKIFQDGLISEFDFDLEVLQPVEINFPKDITLVAIIIFLLLLIIINLRKPNLESFIRDKKKKGLNKKQIKKELIKKGLYKPKK
jgi:hypothetical protein